MYLKSLKPNDPVKVQPHRMLPEWPLGTPKEPGGPETWAGTHERGGKRRGQMDEEEAGSSPREQAEEDTDRRQTSTWHS